VTFSRAQKPDVFEVLMFARTRVFVRCAPGRYVIVSALRQHISLLTFCDGNAEPVSIRYIDEQPGLFDGKAWNLPALVLWLDTLEV